MCRYKKIDLENWCRKEHYLYYTNSLNVEVNMTANIDASELLSFCHTNGYKFYPIAHAVADGYHIGLFFEYLQEEMSVECLKSHHKATEEAAAVAFRL